MKVPFSRPFDLASLRSAGTLSVTIVLPDAEREALAHWSEIESVESFRAELVLTRRSASRYAIEGKLSAAIVQACVVTLDPVPSMIEREIARELLLVSQGRIAIARDQQAPLEVTDSGEEEIESLDYDLAAPLLEEFSLAIDP
ncbi:MAG: hypothetical protein JOZ55_11455 [Alphaproteobacteria bacterium]|nr:hypothetical protein [Alphaproteobacteria bacterium]